MEIIPSASIMTGMGIDLPKSPPPAYNATEKAKNRIEEIRYRRMIADETRQYFAEKAISNQYLYDNVVEEVGNYFSNISVPWPFIITETYVGRAFLELCQDTPYFEVIEDKDTMRGAAKRIQNTINRELYMQKFPFQAILTYRNVFIRGTEFIAYLPWGIHKGIEMPILYTPNWFRVWVNPNVTSLEDDDAFVILDTFMRMDTFFEVYGDNKFWKQKAMKSIEPLGEDPANMYEDRLRSVIGIPNKRFDKYSQLIKLSWYWTQRELCVAVNDNILVRDTENPCEDRIPVRDVWILPDDRSIYKPSLLDIGKDLFAEVNEKRNQRIDATNMILNPHWIAGGGMEFKVNKIPMMPGWITNIGGPIDQIKPVPIDWNILNASQGEEARSELDIMRYSRILQSPPAPKERTATGKVIEEKHSMLASDVYNFLLNLMTVEQIADDYKAFHEKFMTGLSPFNDRFSRERIYADPQDFYGFFTFRAVGSMLGARDLERRDFLGLMNIIFSNPMLSQGALKHIPEWISRSMDYFKIRSPGDLYDNIENFEPQPLQDLLKSGSFGMGKGGGPGMLPMGQPKPKAITGYEGM